MNRKITFEQLEKHRLADGAWLLINGVVWDVTGFAAAHPGGPDIIEEHFGKDASVSYNTIHGPGLAESYFGAERRIGEIENAEPQPTSANSPTLNPKLDRELRPLETIINLHDFEQAAQSSLNRRSWVYFSGAADDGFSLASNMEVFRALYFRPRVLNNVRHVDTSTTFMGRRFDVPVFNAPASLAMLAHPQAEVALARGLVKSGSTIIMPTLASYSLSEVMEALPPRHPFFFQLYVHQDPQIADSLLAQLQRLKPKAIMLTVDLPVFSKREANERYEVEMRRQTHKRSANPDNKQRSQARSATAAISPDLTWDYVTYLKERTGLPIFVKGIQCAEDAVKAQQYGCAGIYISNHGGRAVDTAQPTLLTLAEIRMRQPSLFNDMEVLIDGSIRRGTDVLKAICLGARAVCVGRPLLYSLAYGQEGVEHLMSILRDELETAMQLCGMSRLSEAHPGLLNTATLCRMVDGLGQERWRHRL